MLFCFLLSQGGIQNNQNHCHRSSMLGNNKRLVVPKNESRFANDNFACLLSNCVVLDVFDDIY